MSKEQIFDELKVTLKTIKPNIDTEKLSLQSNLISDIGLDSLSILLLSLAIENKYDFKFEGNPRFNTVGDVVDHIISAKS